MNAQALIGIGSIGIGLLSAAVFQFYLEANVFIGPVSTASAHVMSFFLRWIGVDAHASGNIVTSPEFSVAVQGGCTPIPPLLLYSGAVLGSPAKRLAKMKGLLLGIACLTAANLVRLISLFLIGAHSQHALALWHVIVWPSLLVLGTLALWVYWLDRNAEAQR